ncbi:MAG: ATP-binding protein [Methanobacteriota archaeon]
MRLKIRLMAYFLIFSIVPLTVVGFMAYESGRKAIEVQSFNYLTTATALKEEEIEAWIANKEKEIVLLARSPAVQKNSLRLATHIKTDPVYTRAYEDMFYEFKTLKEEDSDFLEISFLSVKGVVQVSTSKEEGRYESFEKRGVYTSPLEGSVMITAALVKTEEDRVLGTVAGKVSLERLNAIVKEKTFSGRTGEIYLVDSNRSFLSEQPFKKEVHTRGVDECLKYSSGAGFYENYKGIPVIGSYRWMESRQLCILAEIEQAEAFAPVDALRRAIIIVGGGITLIVLSAAVLLSYTVTTPIRQLVRGAEEIGRGNLSHRIDLKTGDEVEWLASAFNAMVSNLQDVQRRLIQSEKLASLGAMATGVAHEINNPLANISLNAQRLLREAKEGDRYAERLKIIQENVDTAAGIVKDLLDFSRESELRRAPVDINSLITKVLDDLKHKFVGIEVVRNFGDLPEILADDTRLRQVFINIIDNACQAMPDGGRLSIATLVVGSTIEIRFTDTGVGIPKENLGKIFDPFFTTREVGKGIGLGLSISYGIIQKHKGKIEVESEVGAGSTFTIKLPVVKK